MNNLVYTPPKMKTIGDFSSFREKYALIQKIGDGGYGIVYICLEKLTGELRAAKIVDGDKCHNKIYCPNREEHIPNEIFLSETLDHPNIVSLLDVYKDRELNSWCLVMQYEPGFHDLFDYMEKHRSLSSTESANIIRQLVKVVYYLTMQNVDHRDLKDENILYNPVTQQIRVIDFGSSAILSPDPYRGFEGTDVYIPPEYFTTGSYASFPASVWAIGCIAYILQSGDSPFPDRKSVLQFTCVEELNPAYKQRTLRNNFIKSCLKTDPEYRIPLSDLIRHPWLEGVQSCGNPLSLFDCLTYE